MFYSNKIYLPLVCGATVYWLFGYSFAFGGDGNGYKGKSDVFIGHDNFALSDFDENRYAFWFFQFVIAATAATIVNGAIAERTEFIAYLIYSALITGKEKFDFVCIYIHYKYI